MTETLALHEPPAPNFTAPMTATQYPRGPWVHYRDPGYLALILAGLQRRGRQALYAGTQARLLAIATDPRVRELLPPQHRWELPPIYQVVQAARRGVPHLLREGTHDLSVLGMMCLPPKAAETLLGPAVRGQFCLIVDGIDYEDADGRFAATGLNDLASRTGASILVLP